MMASRFSTPPPPAHPNTPPAPRHRGFDDDWHPFTPRKSARVQQRKVSTSPSELSRSKIRAYGSASASKEKEASNNMAGGIDSPPPTISKRRVANPTTARQNRKISGSLDEESTALVAVALGLSSKKAEGSMASNQPTTTVRTNGMLPTPVKTPKKSPAKASPAIATIARNLFPIRSDPMDDVMPAPKASRKKYSSFSLDEFDPEDGEAAPIKIYTDSHERVPEEDFSAENPFYGDIPAIMPDPVKRSSKRRMIQIPGEGEQTLEEAEKREDGLIYVFRGKKIFRKFSEGNAGNEPAGADSDTALDAELDATVPARLRGPMTRSSLKPRLLFPTAEQRAQREKPQVTDDEEAVTDIEDPSNDNPVRVDELTEDNGSPTASEHALLSPPGSARATRSAKKSEGNDGPPADGHASPGRARMRSGRLSPFDAWQRTKSHRSDRGIKREGDEIARRGGDVTKRRRGRHDHAV